jgi:hypothetical protein
MFAGINSNKWQEVCCIVHQRQPDPEAVDVEQLAQEAGDFDISSAGDKQPAARPRCLRLRALSEHSLFFFAGLSHEPLL